MTYNVKKQHYTNKFIKYQHNKFPFERVEVVCPLPGAGQNRPLLLLLPSHVQIKDNLLNGGHCLTQRSGKNSSCGEACHTQAYCVCWCCCWGWTSCQNPCRQTHCHCAAKFCSGKSFAKTWKLCHSHFRGEPSLSLVLCPPTLIPARNNMISLTNLPPTPVGPVTSRWAPLFMCSLKLILVLKII